MITKGNQRAGGQQLATHLLNEFDNEYIELMEVRGTVAQDLHGAFSEWKSVSLGTKCEKFLYSLSVNPWAKNYGEITREMYLEFIGRVEQKLGLEGQPRAVVFHIKEGREHCHVVWSRIDVEKMKAVQLSHDRQKLRAVVREFANDHNLELPDGLARDNRDDRFEEKKKHADLKDRQQQERTGLSKAEHQKIVTEIWRGSDSPRAFYEGLESAGYYLCRGDRRSYVVLDRYGEIHTLPRLIDIKGVNTAKVRDFLGKAYPENKIRSIEQAQKMIDLQQATKSAQFKEDFRTASDKLAHDLEQLQATRREALDKKIAAIKERHKKELAALKSFHQSKHQSSFLKRILEQKSGLSATLLRVTGLYIVVKYAQSKLQDFQKRTRQQDLQRLKSRHQAEIHDFKRKQRGLDKVFKRENLSLQTKLRRLEREASRTQQQSRSGSKGSRKLDPSRKKRLDEIFKNGRSGRDHDPDRGGHGRS